MMFAPFPQTKKSPRWPALALAALLILLLPAVAQAGKEPKKRVAVTGFVNAAGWSGNWRQIGNGMAQKLSEALAQSDKFVVLERIDLDDVKAEHDLGQVMPVNPEEEARLTSAQVLVRGTVTDVNTVASDKGGVGIGRFRVGGKRALVKVKVNIRLIDTITGQLLQSVTVEGTAKQRGLNLRGGFKKLNVDTASERELPVGDALDDAMEQAIVRIIDGMERIPWQGSIARVSGRQVFINAGFQENVEPGLQLKVFQKGAALIDPDTNENLGSLDEEIGIIEIEQVSGRFSVARVLRGQGFAPGNLVKPVDVAQ